MIDVRNGDCLEILDTLPENSVDAVVTDPPYELGFMGKSWDASGVAFCPQTWAKVLRVLKPGGHMVAFGAPKNYHRLACAIEDAGFEIRDSLMWVFGTGFPKSRNIGDGWGTALKPAYEPIVLARKPLSENTVAANVLKWRTGALNIDATRIQHNEPIKPMKAQDAGNLVYGQAGRRTETTELKAEGRWPANLCHDGDQAVLDLFPQTGPSKATSGIKRLGRSGGIMGDAGQLRDGRPEGHNDDGGSAARFFYSAKPDCSVRNYNDAADELEGIAKEWDETDKERIAYARWFASKLRAKSHIENIQTEARFFYSAKASKSDRAGSKHPTVKPVALMQWLVKMVAPPGGTVLDPFAGSGTTGEAVQNEGFNAILIERELEYYNDILNRLNKGLPLWL